MADVIEDTESKGFLGIDRAPISVLLVLAALAAVQIAYYYPLLPERLAVHFGGSGAPNGWSGKVAFAATFGATELVMVLFGLGLAAGLDKIPLGLINAPNKDYWFSPERRRESMEFMKAHVVWMEAAALGFLIAIAQLIFTTNLGDDPPRLSNGFWFVIVAFVAVVLSLSLKIILRFRAPN